MLVFALYIVYVLSPLLWPYSEEAKEAYRWRGQGGFIAEGDLITSLMIFGNALSFIGLLMLKDWGRRLMLGITVVYGLSIPLWGMFVGRPLEMFLGYWIGLAMIILLVTSYTVLSHEFEKDR